MLSRCLLKKIFTLRNWLGEGSSRDNTVMPCIFFILSVRCCAMPTSAVIKLDSNVFFLSIFSGVGVRALYTYCVIKLNDSLYSGKSDKLGMEGI